MGLVGALRVVIRWPSGAALPGCKKAAKVRGGARQLSKIPLELVCRPGLDVHHPLIVGQDEHVLASRLGGEEKPFGLVLPHNARLQEADRLGNRA
jgi:hypothetical protein